MRTTPPRTHPPRAVAPILASEPSVLVRKAQCTDPVSPHPRGAIGQVHLNREQVGQARALDARPFRKAQFHPALIGLGGKTLHNAPRRRLIDDNLSPAPSDISEFCEHDRLADTTGSRDQGEQIGCSRTVVDRLGEPVGRPLAAEEQRRRGTRRRRACAWRRRTQAVRPRAPPPDIQSH